MAIFMALTVKAQLTEQLNAILQVGDDISIFYGASALNQALEAAPESGGVITLSSGTFNAPTITKKVTIYGCGWYTDGENDIYPSAINGNITINIPDEIVAPHDIYIEGLYVNDINIPSEIDGLNIVKCNFGSISFSKANKRVNILQCRTRGGRINAGDNVLVKNCYLDLRFISRFSDESTVFLDHCILVNGYDYDSGAAIFYCTNSIVNVGYSTGSQTYRNCVFQWSPRDFAIGSTGNKFSTDYTTFFTDAANTDYSDTRTFTLAEPDNYLGSDGTPVGVTGGDYPWNKQPLTPIVKNLDLKVEGTQLKVTYDAEIR